MKFVQIYLEKVDERWWEKLLEGETALDLKHMHPEKPLDELDEEAQAKIRQMMHDERQKRLGLPTSEEQVRSRFLVYIRSCSFTNSINICVEFFKHY